jgi:type II secretory pathway component PulC
MKTRTIIALLSLSFTLLNANELSWVDEQVNAIKPPREGVSLKSVSLLSNPFIFLEKNRPEKKETTKSGVKSAIPAQSIASTNSTDIVIQQVTKSLELHAIMNKSALISGTWYKHNDVVQGYVVRAIEPKAVVLSKNGKELVLTTESKNLNLKFNNK